MRLSSTHFDFVTIDNTTVSPIYLSLIIPTYNEKGNIEILVKQISTILDEAIPGRYEIIIVDDDSPDRTWEVALSLVSRYNGLKVIRRQNEKGLAKAVLRGWQEARGEILGVMDGDLQHPPEILSKLLKAIEHAGISVASRHIAGGGVSSWSIRRRIISRTAQLLGMLILPEVLGRVSDPMSGYFLVRRSVIAGRQFNPIGYKILVEVLARGEKSNVSEVAYVFKEREQETSKAGFVTFLEYVLHLFLLRFSGWPAVKFIKFCMVGLSGVFVDMALFYLLSDPIMLAWGIIQSKIIAAETAIINNFIWNDIWTFRSLTKGQRTFPAFFKRMLKFNAICFIGLCINVVALKCLLNIFGFNRYLANFIAITVTAFWNFHINFKFNWRRPG
jgi:dolichol-phosphate mannosyltransferase